MAISISFYESANQRRNCCHHTRHVLRGSLELLVQEESFISKFGSCVPQIQHLYTNRARARIWGSEKTEFPPQGPPPSYYYTARSEDKAIHYLVELIRFSLGQNLHPENSSEMRDFFLSGVCATPSVAFDILELVGEKKNTNMETLSNMPLYYHVSSVVTHDSKLPFIVELA